MRRSRHPIAAAGCVLAVTIVVVAGLPGTALAGSGPDNAAVAINTHDDTSVARFRFRITRDVDELVDEVNIAFAQSSCERCQTVAAAIQTVLVMSDPAQVTPQNLALAINQECTSCRTLASAYQFVLTTDGPVHFSEPGSAAIERIRADSEAVVRSAEPIDAIQVALDGLMEQLLVVLRSELQRSGRAGQVVQLARHRTAA